MTRYVKMASFSAIITVLLTTSLLMSSSVFAQQQPPKSPRDSATMTLNGKKISVDYSRPYMKGRKIMGGLVPYAQVWRAGANKATHFTTESDLVIGGVTVPKGTYTLFVLPNENNWKLIINKHTEQWGTPYKYESEELARVDMKLKTLNANIDQFTISLTPSGKNGGTLKMEWEKTSASINFTEKK